MFLLDIQVQGSIQWVLLEISWTKLKEEQRLACLPYFAIFVYMQVVVSKEFLRVLLNRTHLNSVD